MILMNRSRKSIRFIMILIAAIITIYPLLWMISSSFKNETRIFKDLGLIPNPATLENYTKGWHGASGLTFATYFSNSFFICFFVIIGTLISCSMAAYAFARLEYTFKRVFFAGMLVTMMLPMHVTLIPKYIMFYNFGWMDTFLPLIVPAFFATSGFFVFLMVQFIRGIPKELDEAATVDGCGPIQIYIRIILPLALPALVTTAIFSFIWTWNDFFSQLIYISNPAKFPIALGLRAFMDFTSRSAYGQLFAMSVLSLVPIILFFTFSQKLLIEGIATSGIKG